MPGIRLGDNIDPKFPRYVYAEDALVDVYIERSNASNKKVARLFMGEWMKILELSPKTQEALKNGLIHYTEALKLARRKIEHEKLDEILEKLESEGSDFQRNEIKKLVNGGTKKGIPKGKYIILRTTFDKAYPPDMELLKKIRATAQEKEMKIDEYIKWILKINVRPY